MNNTIFSELCKCNDGQICIFCKVLTVICIAAVSALIGYLIGKKKR